MRNLITTGLAWLLLLSMQARGADDSVITVEAHRDGEAVIVEARARLHCEVQLAWDVLTDYDHYAQFIPDLTSSRVMARSGNTAIIEQKGEAGFFLYHFPVEVVFNVTELPGSTVSSQAVSGTFKEMTGTYLLSRDDNGLVFSYRGRLVPEFGLPPLVGVLAVKAAVRKQFTALVHEIARRAGSPGVAPNAR